MDFVKKNIKIIGVVGCLLAVIAAFLPFASLTLSLYGMNTSQSVNFIEGDGLYVVILAVIAGFMLFGKTLKGLKIANINLDWLVKFWWGPLVPIALGLIITIYYAANAGKANVSYAGVGASVSLGIGFYLILVGLIVAAASILYEKFGMKAELENQTSYSSPVPASTTTYSSPVATSTTTYAQPTTELGAQQATVQPEQQPVTKTCPGCGAQVSSSSKFCTSCGTKLQ